MASRSSRKRPRTSPAGGGPTKKGKYITKPPPYILGTAVRSTQRYGEAVSISSAAVAGSVGTYVFSANGLYDPNLTGIGHQPRGYDQLMSMYDHYTVLSATIKVRFMNISSSTQPLVAISVRDSSNVPGTSTDVIEYGNKALSNKFLIRDAATEGTEGMTTVLSKSVNIARFLSRESILSDPQCKGSDVANPAEQVWFQIHVSDPYQASGCSVRAVVEIIYDTVFHEPKVPIIS